MNVGVNLDVRADGRHAGDDQADARRHLVERRSRSRCSTASSSRRRRQHLEMVLPSVFDLVTPLLGNMPADPGAVVRGLLAQQPVDPEGARRARTSSSRCTRRSAPSAMMRAARAAAIRSRHRRSTSMDTQIGRAAAAEHRHARASRRSTRRAPRRCARALLARAGRRAADDHVRRRPLRRARPRARVDVELQRRHVAPVQRRRARS